MRGTRIFGVTWLRDLSASVNPHSTGWRRITDGDPCAFCAMLASRGPAYRTEASALTVTGVHMGGTDYTAVARGMDAAAAVTPGLHRKVEAPTVEEVFGEWEPTAREQEFVDLYNEAHEPGMTPQETAAAMREQGHGVINDARVPEDERKPRGRPAGAARRVWMRRGLRLAGLAARLVVDGNLRACRHLTTVQGTLPEYLSSILASSIMQLPSTQLRSSASRAGGLPLGANRMSTSISARSGPASQFAQKSKPRNGCADVASPFALSTIRPMRGCRTPFWNGRAVHGRLTSRRFHRPIRFRSRSAAGAGNRGVWCFEEAFLWKRSMLD